MRGRRLLAFALVPLSAIPFAAAVPLVAPAVEKRVDHLRERPAEPAEARVEPRAQRAPRVRLSPTSDRPRPPARGQATE